MHFRQANRAGRQEAGGGKQEAGGRKQEAEYMNLKLTINN